jgi:hypothetical protein
VAIIGVVQEVADGPEGPAAAVMVEGRVATAARAAVRAGVSWRQTSSPAMMPVRKTPSNVAAPPMETTGAPVPR